MLREGQESTGSGGGAETREGGGTDWEGHEDDPRDVGFHSDMSWNASRGICAQEQREQAHI